MESTHEYVKTLSEEITLHRHKETREFIVLKACTENESQIYNMLESTHGCCPNVLTFYGMEGHCLVLEYASSGDLLERTTEQRTDFETQSSDALNFLQQLTTSIDVLHRVLGVAHRDISLENLVLRHESVLKLIDFRFATTASVEYDTVGKLFYMAPEVLSNNGCPYDPKAADMWSIGIVYYMLLTGSPLWTAADINTNTRFHHFCLYGFDDNLTYNTKFSDFQLKILKNLLKINASERWSITQLKNYIY